MKKIKDLVAKLSTENHGVVDQESLDRGLIEIRNTPVRHGNTPVMVVFGREMRSILPIHPSAFVPEWVVKAKHRDCMRAKDDKRYNSTAKNLPPLRVGAEVRIQDPISLRWDRLGTIAERTKQRRYTVRLPSGATLVRNRRFLRLNRVPSKENEVKEDPSKTPCGRRRPNDGKEDSSRTDVHRQKRKKRIPAEPTRPSRRLADKRKA